MKQTLKRIIRNVKSINGNSLAEFATTTALMATLAATAAPKLSEMSEGAKAEKSMNEIDKILTQARNFYQTTSETEGRGRFPGQEKYDMPVGEYMNEIELAQSIGGIEDEYGYYVEGSFQSWDQPEGSKWRSVFGIANADAPLPPGGNVMNDYGYRLGHEEWLGLFNGMPLASKYQDGHFIYVVIPGGETGYHTYPPVLYVADTENPSHFNNQLAP